MKKITIAIDGHSSCGKSTMAKDLARRVGYIYVDTGAMYRSVTLYALRHHLFREDGTILTDELEEALKDIIIEQKLVDGKTTTFLNGENVELEIRSLEVSNHVSPIAALPFVRTALVAQQQRMGQEGGVVMDGRDIGTVVFPNAELKIFVTASAEVRAQRRYDELKEKGMPADFDDILKNVQERDYIDSHREVSPLRQADDALLLDNSHMTIPEQNEWLIKKFNEAVRRADSSLQKVAVSTSQAPAAIGPYSQAVQMANLIYTSGQLPINPTTGAFPEGGIQEQTRQSLLNIQAILNEAGLTMNDVVKTTVFLADMNDFADMNAVYATFFSEPYPARSAVAVKTLPKGALVEIEAVAKN